MQTKSLPSPSEIVEQGWEGGWMKYPDLSPSTLWSPVYAFLGGMQRAGSSEDQAMQTTGASLWAQSRVEEDVCILLLTSEK